MMKFKLQIPLVVMAVIFMVAGSASYGYSAPFVPDALMFDGIVKNVNGAAKTVVINVLSRDCGGDQTFRYSNAVVADNLAKASGKVIRFTINSSTCRSGSIYEIIGVYIKPVGKTAIKSGVKK